MQCGAGCCTNVMWCIKVCCTRRTATYSCNSTHMHACYPKPPYHNPPVFLGFFLLERVCGGMCVRRDGFSCTPTPGHLQLKLWCCAFLCSLPRKGGRVHRNAQHNNFSRKRPRVGVPQALYGVHMCMYVCGCVGVGGCGCVWVCVYGCVWVREGWGEGGLEGLSQAWAQLFCWLNFAHTIAYTYAHICTHSLTHTPYRRKGAEDRQHTVRFMLHLSLILTLCVCDVIVCVCVVGRGATLCIQTSHHCHMCMPPQTFHGLSQRVWW